MYGIYKCACTRVLLCVCALHNVHGMYACTYNTVQLKVSVHLVIRNCKTLGVTLQHSVQQVQLEMTVSVLICV